jgi:hypothetical protein
MKKEEIVALKDMEGRVRVEGRARRVTRARQKGRVRKTL